jgi:sporulation protein YlmC with PRC-barrel domain
MRAMAAVVHKRQEFMVRAMAAILMAITLIIASASHAAGAAKPENEETAPAVPQRGDERSPQEKSLKDAGQVVTHPRVSEIIGKTVTTNQKEHLGEVQDLILSSDGQISYLVVSKGGVAGIGAKLCAIPWQASRPTIQEKFVLVNLSKQQFEGAPAFGDWREFKERGYERKVRSYYGEDAGFEDQKQTPGLEVQRETR